MRACLAPPGEAGPLCGAEAAAPGRGALPALRPAGWPGARAWSPPRRGVRRELSDPALGAN
eukprot:scaffold2808_cov421-Prasinococcus_capsulatus_cf.AAC.11